MNLSEYEAAIELLAANKIGEPVRDGYGQRCHETDLDEACYRLASISREIRLILWSAPYRAEAKRLATLADDHGRRIAEEAGLMGYSPLPRFPAGTSGGITYPAID
jgi:hypothetical protein